MSSAACGQDGGTSDSNRASTYTERVNLVLPVELHMEFHAFLA